MINQFSVFKKTDRSTKQIKYIINIGDVHNILPKFNNSQSNELKDIIKNSDENALFLFEYPFTLSVDHESIKKCKDAAALAVSKFNNPIYLHDFAELHNKARNIDHRAHALIFNVFGNLLQDFITSKSTGQRELSISFSDISKLMIDSFDRVFADYTELKTMAENSELSSSLRAIIDVYIAYFEQSQKLFYENKKYAEELSSINDDIIDYLILEFAQYKNYEVDIVVNGLINNDLTLAKDFGYYAGQYYIQKIGMCFFNSIELNILKEIIDNDHLSKIFILTGALHAHTLNELLIKCGYVQVYETIATSVEVVNQLSTSGINIFSEDRAELVPVPSELLRKLSAKKLTKELFENESSCKLEIKSNAANKIEPSISWMRKIFNFLNL